MERSVTLFGPRLAPRVGGEPSDRASELVVRGSVELPIFRFSGTSTLPGKRAANAYRAPRVPHQRLSHSPLRLGINTNPRPEHDQMSGSGGQIVGGIPNVQLDKALWEVTRQPHQCRLMPC
jgi:hypothetical protein